MVKPPVTIGSRTRDEQLEAVFCRGMHLLSDVIRIRLGGVSGHIGLHRKHDAYSGSMPMLMPVIEAKPQAMLAPYACTGMPYCLERDFSDAPEVLKPCLHRLVPEIETAFVQCERDWLAKNCTLPLEGAQILNKSLSGAGYFVTKITVFGAIGLAQVAIARMRAGSATHLDATLTGRFFVSLATMPAQDGEWIEHASMPDAETPDFALFWKLCSSGDAETADWLFRPEALQVFRAEAISECFADFRSHTS